MKRIFLVLALVLGACVLVSCNSGRGAEVEVRVTDAGGLPFRNTEVYMFVGERPTRVGGPGTAMVKVETDPDGKARFRIGLGGKGHAMPGDNLYFAVFYEVNGWRYMAVPPAVSLHRGDSRKLDLSIPVNTYLADK